MTLPLDAAVPVAARMARLRVRPLSWDDLPGWRDDAHADALRALRRTARHVAARGAHRTGALASLPGLETLAGAAQGPALAACLDLPDGADAATARAFFEQWYEPRAIEGEGLGGPDGAGFVTGFYEPTIEASPVRDARYRHAIHAVPPGLTKNDGTRAHDSLPADHAWGIEDEDGLLREVSDRATIEGASLAGAGTIADWPVIAWAADRVDLFFAHIQGAARLAMPDRSTRRITYAAKSGHPFTAIGAELAREGEIAPGAVTMASIRAWLAAHPTRVDELLRRNRSYIFFREQSVEDAALGPVAAARVPLAPGRSLAVDRLLHTFGTPIHVSAPNLAMDGAPFVRLMVAQETGTAIVGAARGDVFTGSGEAAGAIAGSIRHAARFTLLVPRTAA